MDGEATIKELQQQLDHVKVRRAPASSCFTSLFTFWIAGTFNITYASKPPLDRVQEHFF